MQKKCQIDQAMLRKYPEQVVFVVTCGADGRYNLMSVSWTCIASDDPLMLALVIDGSSYTYERILEKRDFVVAFPGENMADQVRYAGSCHGHKIDKLKESGLKTQSGVFNTVPLLADAVVNFECTLVEIYKPGDTPIVIGKVVTAHHNTNARVKRLFVVGPKHKMAGVRART